MSSDNFIEEKERFTALRSYKNLLILGLGYLFLFSAFSALQNLQSSLHPEYGFLSLCLIYGMFLLSCLVVPSLLIKLIGKKYTLVVAMLGFVAYTAANFYPNKYTLSVGSVILGICAAPLWTAQASYTTTIAMKYAGSAGLNQETVISKFFCIFYVIFQMGQVIGNVVSSVVLKQKDNPNTPNASSLLKECGANYCPVANVTAVHNPVEKSTVDLLMYIYLAFGGVAVLCIFLFLDRIREIQSKAESSICSTIFETIYLTKDYKILLMIPLTIFNGLEQAFAFGDLTNAFVSCTVGIEKVGFIMICFGAMGGVSSLALGVIVKWTGTLFLIVFGFALHLAVLVWCLFWETQNHPEIMFYVTAGLWGLGDSIWLTQINALYGIFFPDDKEAAFSHFKLWQSLGFVISFAYGQHLCTSIKLYVLLATLIVGVVFYLIVEYAYRKAKRRSCAIMEAEYPLR